MPDSYSWEIRERAEELYVVDGQTFEQVAESTGVSVTQLKRWSSEAEKTWPDARREYRQALTSIRRNTVLAKAKLIQDVVTSMDPQKAYAFSSLAAASKAMAGDETAKPSAAPVAITREINTADDAVKAMQEVVERKVNLLLTEPGAVSLAAIKEMQLALDLLENLRAKYGAGQAAESNKQAGVSEEALQKIRRDVLGMSA